jgi:hypothetical protein
MNKYRFNRRIMGFVRMFFIACLFTVLQFQATAQDDSLKQQHYLGKSKNQKVFAWVLLVPGVFLVGVGCISASFEPMGLTVLSGESSNKHAGKGAIVAGVVCIAGSIPLFIGAAKNKRKASLSVSTSNVQLIQHNSLARITQPCLKLSVPF